MAQSTKYAIDGTNNTGSIEIYVDGNLETTYVYNGVGGFTLSERPSDVSLTKADLGANIDQIGYWLDLVKKACTNVVYSFAPHDCDFSDDANKTVVKLKFGGTMAIHAVYHKNTGLTEFKARNELVLTPEQFRRFMFVLMIVAGRAIYVQGW